VRTKADLPQAWAMTQYNLGMALTDEGERSTGDKARALLEQAVQAREHVLEVYTRARFPRYWAMTMRALAVAHKDLGDTTSADAESKAANEVDPR
jgi:hypothetical protein